MWEGVEWGHPGGTFKPPSWLGPGSCLIVTRQASGMVLWLLALRSQLLVEEPPGWLYLLI